MCWNAKVSLHTFLFSCLVLTVVWYTNTYTEYKSPLFDNPLAYAALLSVSGIQLVEFFLWTYLDNRTLNTLFSIVGLLLVFLQPVAFFLVSGSEILYAYLIYLAGLCMLIFPFMNIPYTKIGKLGNLEWKWIDGYKQNQWLKKFIRPIWMLFLAISVWQANMPVFLGMGIILFAYVLYQFYMTGSENSVWCWAVNIYMIWLLVRLVVPKYAAIY